MKRALNEETIAGLEHGITILKVCFQDNLGSIVTRGGRASACISLIQGSSLHSLSPPSRDGVERVNPDDHATIESCMDPLC